jgi:membrane-associated phospholipid phosphatase
VLSVLFVRPSRFGRRTLVAYGVALLAIGISRVYLGQHHPSDVIAGWFGAIAMVSAMSLIPVFRPEPAQTAARAEPAR